MNPALHMLAQQDGGSTLFGNVFWMTIAFIFLAAIVGAVVSRRQRDRVLKMFNDYHITLIRADGTSIWGDLRIYAQGMEVQFDTPYRSPHGLVKASHMLYGAEAPQIVCLCRWVGDLTDEERRDRAQQVAHHANPSTLRRLARWARNWFNTIRDAFTQALGALIGQVGRAHPGSVVQQQQPRVEQIGQTVLMSQGYAYEPMLERHIGRPVVLELTHPAEPDRPPTELPGYLAEYSKDFVAIFNVQQGPDEMLELDADSAVERQDLKIECHADRLIVTNLHHVPLVLDTLVSDAGVSRDLGITLIRGSRARLKRLPGGLRLRMMRLHRIDIICPRTRASVRHASLEHLPDDSATGGMAPIQEAEHPA